MKIFDYIHTKYRGFIYFIWRCRRIISWIPVIWNSVDIDYSEAIDVFEYQLTRIADRLESSDAHTERANQYGKRLRIILKLLRKVYNNEYEREYQKEMEKLYGRRDFVFKKLEDAPHLSEMLLEFVDKEYTPEELEKIDAHETELWENARAKQKRAHELLWKLIEHNIQYWWD